MNVTSAVVASVAAAALMVGSLGMAQAAPHPDDHENQHLHELGQAGENQTLARSGRTTQGLPKLVGIVKDNLDFDISDRTPSPGRYKIVVRDSTGQHNWHLYGNGKSISTTVRGTGRWVFRIRLTAGNYRVVCDPHNDEMEFDLIVR